MFIKHLEIDNIKNRRHKAEMKVLNKHEAGCSPLAIYNITKQKPSDIAKGIKHCTKQGAWLLDSLIYLQREGWFKYAIERVTLNGDEVVEYLSDNIGVRDDYAAVISYDKHLASFYYGTVYGIYKKTHKCTIYILKKDE